MYRQVYTLYSHCTNMYVQNNTCQCISLIILCSNQVYTLTYCIYIHVRVHTCLDLVHRIHIPGTYMECTSSRLYVHSKKQKAKKLPLQGFEPKTSSTASRCLNRYASSVVVISNIVTVYVYCCTCRTSCAGPAAPRRHPRRP